MIRPKTIGIAVLAALLVIGGYIAFMPSKNGGIIADPAPVTAENSMANALDSEPAAGEEAAVPETDEAAREEPAREEPVVAGIDVDQAMAPRILGNADAPVTIQEFASLTCSHCAHFHEDTFPQIREKYIDTGKVRFIFNDFPLNTPARDASLVARCLPLERYFKFIGFLFETQPQWAYKTGHRQYLLQNAKLLGGSSETLEACLESEALKQALVEDMHEAAQTYDIQSTPSFVINGTDLVKGAQPFSVFQEKIDQLLSESNTTE